MKLNKTTAKKVDQQEDRGEFEALPAGIYECKLREVTPQDGAKAPYWKWEFEIVEDEFKSRRLWLNTSLSEAALWKFKEVFKAFGVTPDTDTDDLIDEHVMLVVSQGIIQSGARKGEMGNNVDNVRPLGDDEDEDGDDDEPF